MVFRVFLLGLLASFSARGAELEGVKLEDRIRAGGEELQLNGLALRTRVFFKVYVAGLYLPEKTRSAKAALETPGPKRVTLGMLRDVGAAQFSESLIDGLKENTTEAELAALKPQVDALVAAMQRIGEAKKGMVIDLDYAADTGTTLRVNGA